MEFINELTTVRVLAIVFGLTVLKALIHPPTSSPGWRTLKLLTSPVATLSHATVQAKCHFLWFRHKFLPNKTLAIVAALCTLVYVGFQTNGPHTDLLNDCWFYGAFIVWWMGLGILSSVGLGTGMHTGMLFTFPHAFNTVLKAQECGNLEFNSNANMWSHSSSLWSKDDVLFDCMSEEKIDGGLPYFSVVLKVLPVFIVWGCGTAIGEVPPYFIAFMAKSAGENNPDMEDIDDIRSKTDPISKMQVWMLDFMEWGGFWGIVLMAAWPNAAFDMCGIVCGTLLLPLWMFLGATMVGKGFMKAPMQAFFFVAMFRQSTANYILSSSFVKWMEGVVNSIISSEINFLEMHAKKFNAMKSGDAAEEKQAGWAGFLWNMFMICMICYFIKSIFEQLAQEHARLLEEDIIDDGYSYIGGEVEDEEEGDVQEETYDEDGKVQLSVVSISEIAATTKKKSTKKKSTKKKSTKKKSAVRAKSKGRSTTSKSPAKKKTSTAKKTRTKSTPKSKKKAVASSKKKSTKTKTKSKTPVVRRSTRNR